LVNDKLKRSIYRPFAFKFVLLYKRRYKRNDKQEILKDIEKAKTLTITLKTIFGLEAVLSEELEELGYKKVIILNRAVQLNGDWRDVYFLNLHVRCAISVLVQIESFTIRKEDDLYKKCMQIDWTEYFSLDRTFAVKGAVFSEMFRHTKYPFLVVKDAIADTFRDKFDERPNVNIKTPQILFDVYISKNNVTISLNTSGAPLFHRGYREAVGEAPLNEVVAAGMIRMSGWDKKTTFIDPFCGSGTLLIEAALVAAGIPSLIERQHFAFKNFTNFNEEVWQDIVSNAKKRVTELPCEIIGSDISAEMVTKTRRNLRGLPIGRFVKTSVTSFQEFKKPGNSGLMISNPPYGERMGEEIEELYEEMGNWMKTELTGFDCWIISSNMEALKFLGLRPDTKIKFYNGDLECSFRRYSIYSGSKKTKYQNTDD
jgi:putative N6-adenine-specific DNA methylase